MAISASILLGWPFLIAALGQGARFIASGWYGTLLGVVMLALGLIVPLAGLAAALGLADAAAVARRAIANETGTF